MQRNHLPTHHSASLPSIASERKCNAAKRRIARGIACVWVYIVYFFLFSGSSTYAQVGAKVDAITMPNAAGTSATFSHCVVTKIEPDGVKVSHDGGFAKIPYQFLPEAWKKAVPYDDANAKEFKEKQESQSGTTLTDAQKILSAQKDEARIRDEEKAKNDYRERVAALRLQLVGKKTYKEKSPITDQLKRLDIVERERLATLESQKEIARKLEAKKRSDDLQSKK